MQLPRGKVRHYLFLDPQDPHTAYTYQHLVNLGFRRNGSHLYRPNCTGCNQCIPCRVPVDDFRVNRRFRRVLKSNQDIAIRLEEPRDDQEVYELYERYIATRHREGDVYPASIDQLRAFLFARWSRTFFLSSYVNKKLVAVAVTDVLHDVLSAIYTFFEPEFETRSLGVFSVLKQIDECRVRELTHLYLGYWIEDCPSMDYKARYRPIQTLVNGRCLTLE